jgi:hypothetical protein
MTKIHLSNMEQKLKWLVIADGEIIDVNLAVGSVARTFWLGKKVTNKDFKIGHPIYLGDGSQLKYNIEKVEEINDRPNQNA